MRRNGNLGVSFKILIDLTSLDSAIHFSARQCPQHRARRFSVISDFSDRLQAWLFVFTALVVRPTNTITVAGHKITLPCTSRANNESRWDFYDLVATKPKSIYDGNPLDNNIERRISIDFDSCRLRTCNLTIESVQLEDAGYYVCFESSSTARKAVSLVVLGDL